MDEPMTTDDALRAILKKLETMGEDLARAREETLANREEIRVLSERLVYREKWLLGWDEIAGHLGMCAANAMLLGRAAEDPLPHEKIGHNVRARATALDAWTDRRRVTVRRNKSASASRANTERWKKHREKNARPS